MTVKTKYEIGDVVWIYGIIRSNVKPVMGTVIKVVDLYSEDHYIIAISSHIEDLLEIRTWREISQDSNGPVGGFRNLDKFEPTIKKASKLGFVFDDTVEETEDDDPTPDQINAALQKSQRDSTHQPLSIKEPKRKYYRKKKPQ